MARMTTNKVANKVAGGTVGAAVAAIVIWYLGKDGTPPDPELAIPLTAIIVFVVGYLVPPSPKDTTE